MELFDYTQPRRPIEQHGSRGASGRLLAGPLPEARLVLIRLEPGGVLGRHEAVGEQTLVVVAGSGTVSGGDGAPAPIAAGQAARWLSGELHETRAGADGLTVLIYEGASAAPTQPPRRPGRRARLLQRLDQIGASLAAWDGTLALIGLGSAGAELDRLDDFSDLDFFVLVEPGRKAQALDDLFWLDEVAPIAYTFRNTADGYKLLFVDDIFCEFAVFEPDELAAIPFTAGRLVWRRTGFAERLFHDAARRSAERQPAPVERDLDWILGEALTNLYVGLERFHRGEKLSAARFIQGYAVDRLLELIPRLEDAQPADRDPFAPERRFEQRYPKTAAALPSWIQGYERSPESAAAILTFLEARFPIDPAMAAAIRALL